MAMEKGLYAAPMGMDTMAQEEAPLEISIEDPESVEISAGPLTIEIKPDQESEDDFNANLAEYIDEDELQMLASDLISDFEDDISARKDWMQTYVDGLELLGMKIEERAEPWEGACGVYHPLMSEALVKFQSETMMETFPAAGPVKIEIIGRNEGVGQSGWSVGGLVGQSVGLSVGWSVNWSVSWSVRWPVG